MKRQTFKVFLAALALVGLTVICDIRFSINASQAQSESGKQQSDTALSSCPKCKGAMESGIVRDYWSGTRYEGSVWSPGHAKQHIFSKDVPGIKITVYRCSNCGYLESFAK